jgi:hypothetical protein
VPENLEYLNDQFEGGENAFIDAGLALAANHPSWGARDARVTLFNKCVNVMRSVHLGVVFMIHHLTKPGWWAEKGKYGATKEAIQQSLDEFNMFLRISFIQGLFSAIESSLRLFVRALDPKACSAGCADFKNIYEWILKRLSLQRHGPLLDLLRNVRNSMHNNGLFFRKSGDDTVVYKGQTYAFRVGKPNDFVTWKFVLDILPDIRLLLNDIVESPEVVAIGTIPERT